jgi:hypothetical protein
MAEQVWTVRVDPAAEHRRREVHSISVGIVVVMSAAAASAIVPVVDSVMSAVVIAVVAAVVVAVVARWVARRVRWWFEDQADARVAAAWRTQHAEASAAAADWAGVA